MNNNFSANIRSGFRMIKGVFTRKAVLYVQFVVTNRCNLSCRMCGAVSSRLGQREMSVAEISDIASCLRALDTAVVVLTGGEPFIRQDLEEIVRVFSDNGIMVRLQTNATLITAERLRKLVFAGLNGITVSLDSLDCKTQEWINGKGGSWKKSIEGLSVVSEIMPPGCLLGINTVLSRHNIKEIPSLVRFADKIGFLISVIPVHYQPAEGPRFLVRNDCRDMAFNSDDYPAVEEVFAVLTKMKLAGSNIYNSTRFLKEAPDFLKHGRIGWKCLSPTVYFSISSEGRFLPCIDLDYLQDIRVNSAFTDLFKSDEFIRKVKEAVGKCSGCMYPCWPEMSYLCFYPDAFLERVVFGARNIFLRRNKPRSNDIPDIIASLKTGK